MQPPEMMDVIAFIYRLHAVSSGCCAMDKNGNPLPSSNWGAAYGRQGILAPGEDIPGALPGGGTGNKTGTSFSTPIVTGVIGLMLSIAEKKALPWTHI